MGLPPTASPEDIKVRYRQLARQHHPDAGSFGSSARMAEINQAHDELTRDLEGCRRRAIKRTDSTASREPRHQERRDPAPSNRRENRTDQWKDWLARARRATRSRPSRSSASSARQYASRIRVSPQVLTICRHHGPVELRISGDNAAETTVLFSPSELEVVRSRAAANEQSFSVRLTGTPLGSDGSVQLRVRIGGLIRKVPVYEFSCPTAAGSCAFAS